MLRLPDLKLLRLSLNAISPQTLARLTAQKQLTELVLRNVPLNDAQFVVLLADRPQLQHLALRRVSGVSDAGLEALVSLPRLEVLSLVEIPVSGKFLARLKDFPRLRSLDLRKCDALQTDDYRRLIAVKPLEELKLSGPSAGDAALEIVAAMPSLDSLVIEDSSVSAKGIQGLAEGDGLAGRMRSLTFTRCYGVSDEALRIVAAMPRLETLSIRRCPVSGDFLLPWADAPREKIPKLRTLVVTDAFLSAKAVAVLPRFASSLRQLDLSRVALSPGLMKFVGELRELESLRLAKCSLNDEAVKPIAHLKKLALLDLAGNFGITDESAGLLRSLPHLKQLETEHTGMSLFRKP